MKNRTFLLAGLPLAVLLWAGCNQPPTPDKSKPHVAALFADVYPGDLAIFSLKGLKIELKEDIKVTFGNEPSLVVDFSNEVLKVMVPNLKEGIQKVTIQAGGKEAHSVEVNVLPSRSIRLQMTMEKGKIRLVNSYPSNDAFSQTLFRGEARILSFDVIARSGELLATGVIPDPRSGMETLSEKKEMERVDGPPDVMFNVNIPNFPDAAMIRFYEVDPKTPLTNEDGMNRRKMISETTL